MPSLRTTLRIYFYDGVDSRAYLGINLETGEVFGYSGGHGPFDKMYVVELAQVNQPRFLDFQIALIDKKYVRINKIVEE